MSQVIVTIVWNGNRQQKTLNERNIMHRSIVLRNILNGLPDNADDSPKRVEVHGSFGPMGMVLDEISAHGHARDFKLHFVRLTNEQKAMLWEASQVLQVVPEQNHLRQHLRGWVTHDKLSPQELITLHRIFEPSKAVVLPGEKKSTWEAMIHQTAWFIEGRKYTNEEIEALQQAAEAQFPELAAAILNMILDLQRRRKNFEAAQANAERKKMNRRVAEHKAAERERKAEELRGERELTEGMAKHVITRPPPTWVATVKEGRHGKRNPAGQGKRSKVEGEKVGENGEGDEQ